MKVYAVIGHFRAITDGTTYDLLLGLFSTLSKAAGWVGENKDYITKENFGCAVEFEIKEEIVQ